ncbi:MAG: (deoxy)nucleoside triphosphate pyrophosphohydrolase [Bacilli bacterium]|nr:(deoxy)nucleoside triphosphate pyrophosphohydrolase [Bacilli bacterium]
MITVVAALIKKDNKVLIAKRATGNEYVLGKWEFPGGKVEVGETEEQAIEREIKEEFDMDIKCKKFIANNICEYPNRIIDLRLYECEYLSGDFKLNDHFEYAWVEINNLLDYDLANADIPLAKFLNS